MNRPGQHLPLRAVHWSLSWCTSPACCSQKQRGAGLAARPSCCIPFPCPHSMPRPYGTACASQMPSGLITPLQRKTCRARSSRMEHLCIWLKMFCNFPLKIHSKLRFDLNVQLQLFPQCQTARRVIFLKLLKFQGEKTATPKAL